MTYLAEPGRHGVASRVAVYNDKDCKTKFMSLGNESERTGGGSIEGLTDTYELDIDFKKLLATAHSAEAAGFLKQAGCGSGDFTVDKEKDVSSTGCLFFAKLSKCSKDFDIIKRVEDKLYNGVRAGDQCVVAGRPKKLNTYAFVKK